MCLLSITVLSCVFTDLAVCMTRRARWTLAITLNPCLAKGKSSLPIEIKLTLTRLMRHVLQAKADRCLGFPETVT